MSEPSTGPASRYAPPDAVVDRNAYDERRLIMRVLVIGGGIGGLCLANGLVQAGIEVEVFERSARYSPALPGDGLHLDSHGLHALRANLPAASWAMVDTVAQYADDVVRFHDSDLRVLGTVRPALGQDAVTRRRGIGRATLREVLLDRLTSGSGPDARGFDGVLRWEHEFIDYHRTAGGQIRAMFADGNEAVGDLLIGADGTDSAVRERLLPTVRRVDLGVVSIAGRVELTGENVGLFPSQWLSGSENNIVPVGSGWMSVVTCGTPPEPGQRLTTPGDSAAVGWVWFGLRSSYPADLFELAADELRKIVLARITGWAEVIETMVRSTPDVSMTPTALRSMPELPVWASTDVTLMGDAIHTMSPVAGAGANLALRDAEVLRRALVEAHHTGSPVAEAVCAYEVRMREYANPALAQSIRCARYVASEARLSRRAFRALLRLAEAVPALKTWLFPGPAAISTTQA
jgi:2-polyprenyl-6-methoxyphenol hydroxylase-like FAD-dependent oxidoreductase